MVQISMDRRTDKTITVQLKYLQGKALINISHILYVHIGCIALLGTIIKK